LSTETTRIDDAARITVTDGGASIQETHIADDPETSERWRAELAAGKLPQTNENDT
jgi:hypothetical protein